MTKHLYTTYFSVFLFLFFFANAAQAQFFFDFETPENSTPIEANAGAIVANPDPVGNESEQSAYYNKPAGNWSFFALPFADGVAIGNNDRVSFKVRTSTSGRIYIKFWDGEITTLESWVVNYDYNPEPNTWTELSYDISAIQNQNITRLEVAVSVDNETAADVYFDDIRLYNSLSPDGEPTIDIADFSACVEFGTSLILDASGSIDIGGSISTFYWDLGDGTTIENMNSISHVYQAPGFYDVSLTVTDNEGKIATEAFRIWVFTAGDNVSTFFSTADTYLTNEKVELGFLTKTAYNNPFNPDEVSVNALITHPDGTTRKVPCFFYEKVGNENGSWMSDNSENHWMVRWSSEQTGTHQVQLEITDAGGQKLGTPQEVNLSTGITKGIIRESDNNRQFYQHSGGEMYYPFGINAGWDGIADYTKIIENLSNGKANWMRYWHAAFTNQALEWKDGLNNYSAIAAAKQDSLIALCKENEVYLQMCIFHHGMFSQTVNSNWRDSPYNVANGGYLTQPEAFFYNEEAKTNTKKLLRYVVARWGYAPEVFAWELFNEVQWTGNHPNQSAQWEAEVILWHDEMGQYLKEIDDYDHLVTTSAEDNQLHELADKEGIDIIQYHTYPDRKLVNNLLAKDAAFLEENINTSVICGEYGYLSNADVPFDEQRLAIWSSIFSQVPHAMWIWDSYKNSVWSDLFIAPATFMQEEEILEQEEIANWSFFATSNGASLRTEGFSSTNQNAYGLIYDENFGDDISDATVDLSDLPFGVYNLETTDIKTGVTTTEEGLQITFFSSAYPLPTFSDGLVLKAAFVEELDVLLAFAGTDAVIGLGQGIDLSGMQSLVPAAAMVSYEWTTAEQPASAQTVIPNANALTTNVVPNEPGQYRFVFTMMDANTNEFSADTVGVYVSAPPVAVAGEDIVVALGVRPLINGRGSYDLEEDPLSYAWRLITKPVESTAELEYPTLSIPVLDPDVVGTYALELVVADAFNESQPDTVLIQVGINTAVAVVTDLIPTIQLFPNPTSKILNIQMNGTTDNQVVYLNILDLTGKVLATQQTTLKGQQSISIALSELGLTDGIYLVKIASESMVRNLPFVVQSK